MVEEQSSTPTMSDCGRGKVHQKCMDEMESWSTGTPQNESVDSTLDVGSSTKNTGRNNKPYRVKSGK